MNFTRHFFIEGQYLGSAKDQAHYIRNAKVLCPPQGHFFFCAHCSRLWAECPVEGQASMIWSRACKNHSPGAQTGGFGPQRTGVLTVPSSSPTGSIWLDWEPEFTATFPPRVLEWEIARHLAFAVSTMDAPVASAAQQLLNTIINR